LMLNPISVAIMPSFMTEMPSLALMLGCLLALVQALTFDSNHASSTSINFRLLLVSLVLALIAGANRQPLWAAYLGALTVVFVAIPPARRPVVAAGTVTLIVALSLSEWFSHQPYAVAPQMSRVATEVARFPLKPFFNGYELLNLTALFSLPLILLM